MTATYTIVSQKLLAWRSQQLAALDTLDNAIAKAHSTDELARELDWLLREVTGLDRLRLKLGLMADTLDSLMPFDQIDSCWQQRVMQGMPLQYLLGYTTWRNFRLSVSPAVLIPRPETELLIDIVAQSTMAQGHWVDLGTGSGAIALGLADVMPQARIFAVDISEAALAIAQGNARKLGFGDRIQFYQGSWFEPLPHGPGELQGICSNPPYIPSSTISTLQPEVQNHEPHLALDGGQDGLRDIRYLVQQGQHYLSPHGTLIVECMAGQGKDIAQMMDAQGYDPIQIHEDLAGFDRFVQGVKTV